MWWVLAALAWAFHVAVRMARERLRSSGCSIERREPFRSVLLVTAHPDDECMFFTPTIRALQRVGTDVRLLCLSTGDYDGLGKLRVEELKKSCAVLGVRCAVLDRAELRDGPLHWTEEDVADAIAEHLRDSDSDGNSDIEALLTFDGTGVSGHPNHCSVSRGVRHFASHAQRAFTILELESLPIYIKYLGPLSLIYVMVRAVLLAGKGRLIHAFAEDARETGVRAMGMHASQLVWFRRLYVVFSSYMYINALILRQPVDGEE